MDSQYTEIDELVFRYQEGDEDAGLELLRTFGYQENEEPTHYLGKYYRLMLYEKMDFSNRDLRRFVALFSSSLNQILKKQYIYTDTRIQAMKRIHLMTGRIRSLDNEEIIQDLCCVLLQMAKRYQQKGFKKNFCGYLYNSYRYELYRHWKYLFKDLHYHSHTEYLEEDPQIEEQWIKEDSYFQEDEELSFNWIHGYTTSFPFNTLSVYDRNLLHLSEVKKLSYEEIGEMMGRHRDTIYNHRKRIKNELYQLCKKQHLVK